MIPSWYKLPVFLIPKLNKLDVLQLLVPQATLFLLTSFGIKLAFWQDGIWYFCGSLFCFLQIPFLFVVTLSVSSNFLAFQFSLFLWKCLFFTAIALFQCCWLQKFFCLSIYTIFIVTLWVWLSPPNLFFFIAHDFILVMALLDFLLLAVTQASNSISNLASFLWTQELNMFWGVCIYLQDRL